MSLARASAPGAAALGLVLALAGGEAPAQQPGVPRSGIELRGALPEDPARPRAPAQNTTVVPRTPLQAEPAPGSTTAQVTLVALPVENGQRIEQGLVWHVFTGKPGPDGKPRLVSQHREATPVLRLLPGEYLVNAAYGRANLTRRITVPAAGQAIEQFVLNVGGVRVTAYIGNQEPAPPASVSIDIYSDERDQFGNRTKIAGGIRPGTIVRLNSGLYHLVSLYGDANAGVRTDFTVEPGKLTEAAIAHAVAKVTFKLVTRAGGEALADTQWSIATEQGELVKESAGALPTHALAPGIYVASAKHAGRVFRRPFTVRHNEALQVEVLMQ